jgi:hypothetical protein
VPVVARDGAFVFGQDLEAVAAFVGLNGTGHRPLTPDVLVDKWINILRAAQRYVRQMPTDRLKERATENRDRSIRVLAHHTFRVAEAFLESVINGVEYSIGLADVAPQDGTCTSGHEIAAYGDGVIGRLKDWWTANPAESPEQPVQTYYGQQTRHQLLERSTWHSAQHVRQLIFILERYGIAPDRPLVAEDLAGLPLPQRLFE